jgi:hypothetical protein
MPRRAGSAGLAQRRRLPALRRQERPAVWWEGDTNGRWRCSEGACRASFTVTSRAPLRAAELPLSERWMSRLAQTICPRTVLDALASKPSRNRAKSRSARRPPIVPRTCPVVTSKLAITVQVPWRRCPNSCRSTRPGLIGRDGAIHLLTPWTAFRPLLPTPRDGAGSFAALHQASRARPCTGRSAATVSSGLERPTLPSVVGRRADTSKPI